MKQDSRGLVLQAQGLQCLGERVVTTAAEAVIQNNDFTLAINLATPGPLTIPLPMVADLPVGPGSVRLRIRDAAGNAATHNITISGSGALILGSPTVVINTNWGSIDLEWTGAEWTPWGGSGNGGAIITGAGDWTGPSNANTVVKIQHNPILAGLLGLLDAGKSLAWDGARWLASSLSALLYAPAIPGNWTTVPTNPQDALDQLAARITALESVPGAAVEEYACASGVTRLRLVYKTGVANQAGLADASDPTKMADVQFVASKPTSITCRLQDRGELAGWVADGMPLIPGAEYFADPTTPGGISTTGGDPAMGEVAQSVGFAKSTDVLDVVIATSPVAGP